MKSHYHVTIHASVPLQPILINDEIVNRHIFEFVCDDIHEGGDNSVHFHNASIGTQEAPWVCDFMYVVPAGHSVTYTRHEENENEGQPDTEFDATDHAEVSARNAVHTQR